MFRHCLSKNDISHSRVLKAYIIEHYQFSRTKKTTDLRFKA